MINEDIISKLRERYDIHPLMFHRSVEYSSTAGDLFDVLETIPEKFPIIWDDKLKRWMHTKDIFQSESFNK